MTAGGFETWSRIWLWRWFSSTWKFSLCDHFWWCCSSSRRLGGIRFLTNINQTLAAFGTVMWRRSWAWQQAGEWLLRLWAASTGYLFWCKSGAFASETLTHLQQSLKKWLLTCFVVSNMSLDTRKVSAFHWFICTLTTSSNLWRVKELLCLSDMLPEELRKENEAATLVIRNGASVICSEKLNFSR